VEILLTKTRSFGCALTVVKASLRINSAIGFLSENLSFIEEEL